MSGRIMVITGASDGVGAAAARQLAAQGEQVVVVGRNPQRTLAIATELAADHFVTDFAQLDQVRELAAQLLDRYPRIDVLANNAGAMVPRRQITVDGFELTFQANHLAPFLLTNLLLERLLDSRASVINTASEGHRFGRINLADPGLVSGWTSWKAYGNSKLANVAFTRELNRRYGLDGLSAVSFHPGVVASGFARDAKGPAGWLYASSVGKRFMITPDQAGEELVFLAEGLPPRDWASGLYYVKHQPSQPSKAALDEDLAAQLWDRSAEWVGLTTASS